MKKLLIIFLFITIKGIAQQQPFSINNNNAMIVRQDSTLLHFYFDGFDYQARTYKQSLGPADSTTLYYPLNSNPKSYMVTPTITTNNVPYWNGTALTTGNLQYSTSSSGRYCFGCGVTSLIDKVAFDSTWNPNFYNRSDHTVNTQKFAMGWSSSTFKMKASRLGTSPIPSWDIEDSARILLCNGNTASITGILNWSTGAISNSGYSLFGISGSSFTGSGGGSFQYGFSVLPTINQTSSAGAKMIFVSPHITTSATGEIDYIDLGKNSADDGGGTHTSYFKIDSAGRQGINGSFGTANQFVGYNSGATGMEFKSFAVTNGVSVTHATNSVTFGLTDLTPTGNLTLAVTKKISITEGTNASVGQATLSGGTVTVSTTAVTANSRIFLTDATTGALTNIGTPTVGTIVAGTSFVINSTNVLDTSKINWVIFN